MQAGTMCQDSRIIVNQSRDGRGKNGAKFEKSVGHTDEL